MCSLFARRGIKRFGIRVNDDLDYPSRFREVTDLVELLYFLGAWDLVEAPRRIAVVGTHDVSAEEIARTRVGGARFYGRIGPGSER